MECRHRRDVSHRQWGDCLKAVDTNILVRFLVEDSPEQVEQARAVINAGVFVSLTVLIELGWVLQSIYKMSRNDLCKAVRALIVRPDTLLQDESIVSAALLLVDDGADFADAIHLVAARGCASFVTFDRGVPDAPALGVTVERIG